MMRSLYSGISGLQNHQTRMDVVGNNIGNVNTTGFKSSSVSFEDILSQTVQGASGATGNLGGTNPVQVGLGVGLASINTNFTDGSLQSTGKATDLAISGSGFFVLSDGNNQLYTRSGSFGYDTSGNLVVPGTGYKVMGYMADSTGKISANAALQTIQIPTSTTMAAKATTKVTYADNLNASASAIGSASLITSTAAALVTAQAAVDAAAGVMANADALGPTTADTNAAIAIAEKTPTDVANAATLATTTLAYSAATAAQTAATTAKADAVTVKADVDAILTAATPALQNTAALAAQAASATAVTDATAAVTAATPATLASATQAEKDAKATKALIDAIVAAAGTATAATIIAAQTSAATAKITATTASSTADTAATVALNAKTAATTAKTASAAAITAALNTAVTADTTTQTAAYNAAVSALAAATTADTNAQGNKTTADAASALVPGDTLLLSNLGTAYTALSTQTAKDYVNAKAALASDPYYAPFQANVVAAANARTAADIIAINTYYASGGAYDTIATTSTTALAVVNTTAAANATFALKATATTDKATTASALATAQSDATTMVNTVAAAKIGVATAATNLAAAQAAVTAANDKSSDKTTALSVYDTQGNKYSLSGTFEKTGSNTWAFTPDSTIKNSSGVVIANVTTSAPISIVFNADGSFKQSTAAATITIDQTGLTPSSPYVGAGAFTVTPDFSTMTQYGSATTASATEQDGYASGSLTSKNVNSSGVIVGTFDNGQTKDLAQVVLANFNNPAGLVKSGNSLYVQSNNSGIPQVGTAKTAGRGGLTGGSLEMSNVDLAAEFSNMIVTQRGFQANSKIITTADTMLDELVNLKR